MLWVCNDCGTVYAPGLDRCPHCGSTDHREQGTTMPKSTRHQGASHDPTQTTGDAAPETEPASERPAASASKADWVDYASTLGADDDTLAGTKADIVAWVDSQ